MSRYNIYHTHTKALIGTAETIEEAIFIGEQYGCKDKDCPCNKYVVYDNILKTSDIIEMVKDRINKEGKIQI